jgi:hypothetical protein
VKDRTRTGEAPGRRSSKGRKSLPLGYQVHGVAKKRILRVQESLLIKQSKGKIESSAQPSHGCGHI